MDEDMKNKDKKSGCLVTFLTVITFLSMAFAVFYITIWRVPDNSKEIEVIKGKVENRLETAMTIPPDDNGWTYYEKGLTGFTNMDTLLAKYFPEKKSAPMADRILETGIKPEDLPILAKWQNENKNTLEDCAKGFSMKSFQVPYDYKKHFHSLYPNFTSVRDMARFLVIVGEAKEKDSPREALDLYLETLMLGQGLERNGALIHAMMGAAVGQIALPRIKKFIDNGNHDAATSKYITTQMVRICKGHPTYRDIMDVDFISVEYAFQDMMSGNMRNLLGPGASTPFIFKLIPMEMVMKRERNIFRNLYLEGIKSMQGGQPPANPAKFPHLTILAQIMAPDMSGAYKRWMFFRARYDGVMVLSALMWHKKEKGSFPDDLTALVPDYLPSIPADPYSADGKFIYRKDGDKLVLYSIGPDRKDDGGKSAAKNNTDSGDMVFAAPQNNGNDTPSTNP